MTTDILCERRDGVSTVTFNRPERRNAITYEGWQLLSRIAQEVASDDGIRVVVFTGSGELAFSAGADIADFDRYRHDDASAKEYAAAFDGALDTVAEHPEADDLPHPGILHRRGMRVEHGDRHAYRRLRQPIRHSRREA